MTIDYTIKGGEYWTPDMHLSKKFFVKVQNNQIHCYTGKKCDGLYKAGGNVVFNNADTIVKDVVTWLKTQDKVCIGSTKNEDAEKPSLESFLRKGGYSNVGKLGSFFAPLLGSSGLNIAGVEGTRPNKIKLK